MLQLRVGMLESRVNAVPLSTSHRSYSATGTRTRVARVKAEYPNQLDQSGSGQPKGTYF